MWVSLSKENSPKSTGISPRPFSSPAISLLQKGTSSTFLPSLPSKLSPSPQPGCPTSPPHHLLPPLPHHLRPTPSLPQQPHHLLKLLELPWLQSMIPFSLSLLLFLPLPPPQPQSLQAQHQVDQRVYTSLPDTQRMEREEQEEEEEEGSMGAWEGVERDL